MTDDEILLLADHLIKKPVCVQIVTHMELIAFAQAIAAKEREACAQICEQIGGQIGVFGANAIRARGMK